MPGVRACTPSPRRGRRVLGLVLSLALAVGACSRADESAGPSSTPDATPSASSEPEPTAPASDPPPDFRSPPEPTRPPPPPPEPASRPALAARVEELLATAEGALDGAELAVLVTDAYGREVAARDADAPVLPASTQKIVTAAAALLALGPDARLTTRVDATGAIGRDGVLDGDLVLVGAGDPALATPEYGRWIYPARPRTPLEALADQLVEAGLERVTGGIRGTAPGFMVPTEARGWLPRYFANFDARYVTGLTVDGGLATSIRWPQLEEQRAEAADDEPTSSDGGMEDDAAAPEPITIPLIGTREEIESRLAGLDPPLARVEVVPDPRAQAAAELGRLLAERGVEVMGEPDVAIAARDAVARGLASVDSPPLEEILRFAVQRSDNHLTDHVFHVVGRHQAGATSWYRSERAIKALLDEQLGVDASAARLADGSGLSRDDVVSARLLVDIGRAMWDSDHADIWASLHAVAGESGTLRQRLRGTPAAGRLYGKTGTLNDVTALTGAVIGDDGERYHLAVVANDATGADRWAVRALMDELALLLVADLQGCEIAPRAGTPPADEDGDGATDADDEHGPLGRPPTEVSC